MNRNSTSAFQYCLRLREADQSLNLNDEGLVDFVKIAMGANAVKTSARKSREVQNCQYSACDPCRLRNTACEPFLDIRLEEHSVKCDSCVIRRTPCERILANSNRDKCDNLNDFESALLFLHQKDITSRITRQVIPRASSQKRAR